MKNIPAKETHIYKIWIILCTNHKKDYYMENNMGIGLIVAACIMVLFMGAVKNKV